MAHDKVDLELLGGEVVKAQAPVVVSASRATDVPAFYSDWFLRRLEKGWSAWRNPFNGVASYVSYAKMRFVVFWSKNPRPLLESGLLDWLEERKIGCYVQFTLNDYEREGLEKGVPPLAERIDTFRRLSDRLRKDDQPSGVVWRFDPMILADEIRTERGTLKITTDDLLAKAQRIGDALKGYTEKMVFSFADIGAPGASYAKVQRNLTAGGVTWREFDLGSMRTMAQGLATLNRERGWDFTLATCAEKIDLGEFGIVHNKCIDDELIVRRAYADADLTRHLGVEVKKQECDLLGAVPLPPDAIPIKGANRFFVRVGKGKAKDAGQRAACGCAASKDIGQYNTCPHLCTYCYANASQEAALRNWQRHKKDPSASFIVPDETP